MKRMMCSAIIMLSAFYAWLMTATGIQLTQYRPAFSGWVGGAQPYVLAGLVQIAITYYYLKLASPKLMGKREMTSMVLAAPFVLLFVCWTIFMSCYSIMYDRRSETARIESGNDLLSIADELRDLDHQISINYGSTLANLDQRLASEISSPEPGVPKGCGPRCREIRSVQSELQNFQYLREPSLGPSLIGKDLGRGLGILEGEQQGVAARLTDFEAVLSKFSRLNATLAGGGRASEDGASKLAAQFRSHFERLRARLAELHGNERNLIDAKYRGITELVHDISSAFSSGETPRILDMATILLIAIAPDFLSLIMALLSRTSAPEVEPKHVAEVGGMGVLVRKLRRHLWLRSTAQEVTEVKAVVKEHLLSRANADQLSGAVAARASAKKTSEPLPGTTPASAPKEPESIYQTLEKMDMPIPFKRPTTSRR